MEKMGCSKICDKLQENNCFLATVLNFIWKMTWFFVFQNKCLANFYKTDQNNWEKSCRMVLFSTKSTLLALSGLTWIFSVQSCVPPILWVLVESCQLIWLRAGSGGNGNYVTFVSGKYQCPLVYQKFCWPKPTLVMQLLIMHVCCRLLLFKLCLVLVPCEWLQRLSIRCSSMTPTTAATLHGVSLTHTYTQLDSYLATGKLISNFIVYSSICLFY